MTNLFASENLLAVALIQSEAIDCFTQEDIEKNVHSLCQWIEWSARAYPGIDLIVFPESCVQGALPDSNPQLFIDIPGPVTEPFARACAKHKIWALLNVLEKSLPEETHPYNSTILIDAEGHIVLKQHKINPFVPTETSLPGNELHVCKGPKGSVFGIMTCYDGDFPEVARELSLQGANVLLRPSSYMEPYSEPWTYVNRARAYENLAYVIAVNRVGMTYQYNWFGGSMVVDYTGKVLTHAPYGIPWATKVDIDPRLAETARKEFRTHNHLYNLKHRGYSGLPPEGDQRNIYSVYRDWT